MAMDMRLAYRIATLKPTIPQDSCLSGAGTVDAAAVYIRLSAEAEMIARAPKLIADNVAAFYAAHDRIIWKVYDDIPNWAPPFSQFWVEWNEPDLWNMGKGKISESCEGQTGVWVMAFPVTDRTRGNVQAWNELLGRAAGGASGIFQDLEVLAGYLARANWVLLVSPWGTLAEKPLCGNPLWYGLAHSLFVDSAGKLIHACASGLAARWYQQNQPEALWSVIHILGLTLSFCHCKNIHREESDSNRGERWHRRNRTPVFRFHTLNIGTMREVLRREGRSQEVGIQKAMHICRGHFATYTPESPLFGKYVGDFWRPDHVRGNSKQGVVVKDYNVGK